MIKMANNDTIDALKLKLKSATKLKLLRERDMCKIRDEERSITDELALVKGENEFLREQLEDLKTQIAQARQQISLIEICSTSEKGKIEAHIAQLENHRKGFQDIFDKDGFLERNLHELRMKELHHIEAVEEEIMRQKEKDLAEKNEQQAKEVAALEAECEAFEQECSVLKKRNNAIMLKLRRKLLETENTRRERMKRNADTNENTK